MLVGRGCSSVVERQLPKLNVVGSSPIARFIKPTTMVGFLSNNFLFFYNVLRS